MKYTYIKKNHNPIEKTYNILNVLKSRYYDWLKRIDSKRAKSNREIIGWELGSTLETKNLLTAFEKALSRRGYPKEVIFHSDRGV
ncbi:hypothetical protein M9Y90_18550 [Leptospira interrogans]|uniref:hypothetical protein n=1 Tax=Leptospira interrogans TaxID=173 RepID=UPI001787E70F|nr:hypothetical protein [Leptospira interrogans]MCL8312647.1 hypothetical protein [Leptospira interrogans]